VWWALSLLRQCVHDAFNPEIVREETAMSRSATSPMQASLRLSGLQNNHNETLITAQQARLWGLQMNHNETLITRMSSTCSSMAGTALPGTGSDRPTPRPS
jgi:hypothetical protein